MPQAPDCQRRRPTTLNSWVQARSWAVSLTLTLLTGWAVPACAQNAIVTENQLAGTAPAVWDIAGVGETTLQGYSTDISVNRGTTVRFKIKSTASAYHIDIYRIGYYQGNGARLVGTGVVTGGYPQSQPNPITDSASGLIDYGNWAESAHWDVPAGAVSGIYFARLIRNDNNTASHIVFVVRDDASTSDLFFQTSDATWQAYNGYGGNSLYTGTAPFPNGHAAKVSYNRPFSTRAGGAGGGAAEDWVFNAEYPMVRFLEANGYNVSYTTDVDTDRRGNLITNHKVFLSVGHDEYWSAGARNNVTAARNAGVHLAFFSGNEIYWKTRYENSIAGTSTSYRTLVCYKEGTLGENVCNTKCDPLSTSWTGLWRSGCSNTPPADGCAPENALSGQISWDGTIGTMQVPSTYKNLRFWRNTSVAALGAGQTESLTPNTLGYEWDWEQFPDSYPSGRMQLSGTLLNNRQHHLSLYRASSGALVFGAGTVQWSWGLDGTHDRGGSTPSASMRQATVNLFADMGVQPASLVAGLTAATMSTDLIGPTTVITSPVNGAQLSSGSAVVITGTATDAGGAVAGVEVSVDGGTTWHRASGMAAWSYTWSPVATGAVTIKSRGFDDSGNMEGVGEGGTPNIVSVTVVAASCPCTIWNAAAVPTTLEDSDTVPTELGVKLRASTAGFITALRFYKSAGNTGTHIGSLWSAAGSLLAQATYTGETASGWQQVTLNAPFAVAANTTYVVSYHTMVGRYSSDGGYFGSSVGGTPLRALADGEDGGNGVYAYSTPATFPNQTFGATNYWVDAVFTTTTTPDLTPPTVLSQSPADGSSGVPTGTSLTATFSEAVLATSVGNTTFELRDNNNALVAASVSYDALARTAMLTPANALDYSTVYTARLKGGGVDPRIKDLAGNALAADVIWSFTTTAPPPPPPTDGPGGPILVISKATNPFSRYYAEILRAEGLNAFSAMDVSLVDATVLANYDVVILGEMTLSALQVSMLTDWTTAGGTLIAMRPDAPLASLLGLTPVGTTLSNAYLGVNTAQGPGVGITALTMQYHGTADRYTLNGATSLATLYTTAAAATANPAVTTRSVGASGGLAIAWSYDLARSVIYTRQGNPAWSGQKRDGQSEPIRSDDLFYGNAPFDPQPDWVDFNKIAIPQADEQQRLLANVILQGNLHRKPLPRFWYLPKGLKAAIVMGGDDHGDTGMAPRFDIYTNQSPAACSADDWECVRATGYEYLGTHFLNGDAQFYNNLGFEVALHINTGCARTTKAQYDSIVTAQLAQFAAQFPGIPAPQTNRNHCIAWSDWSSVAEVEAAHGIRFDTNYYYWPAAWVQDRPGLFTGSGFPMRFAKSDGTLIDCYQAATQMPDESGLSLPAFCDVLLDRALGVEGFYGVFTANMHFDTWPSPGSDAIVASAQARGIPVVSSKQMLDWIDGRNGSSFGNLSWNSNALSFTLATVTGARNLRAMLPMNAANGRLSTLSRNGGAVTFTTQTIKGIEYAFFPADPGSWIASYASDTTPPVISAVSASPHVDGSATITWTTNEAANSRVDYGATPATMSLNASDAALVTSHTVTLTGLSPSTTYYYRVTSADISTNAATEPPLASAPLNFIMPAPACFSDATDANFAAGTQSNTAVVNNGDGEVILAPALGNEFSGGTLPVDWVSNLWSNGLPGGATVAGGGVSVAGARLTPVSLTGYSAGRVLEFTGTFAAAAFQHVGFGTGNNTMGTAGMFGASAQSWAIFSTGSTAGPSLYARLNPGGDVNLGSGYIGSAHRFRIEWRADSVVFMIDGASVNRRAAALTNPMRPGVSALPTSPAINIDWLRLSPYAASGTFASRVYDAGVGTAWNALSWTAQTPAGTSVAMAYRVGPTAVPDGSWGAYVPVANSGGAVGVASRYIQYRASLATTDVTRTPVLLDVAFTCCGDVIPPVAITDLAAQRLASDTNGDGTRQVRLTFTPPGDATSVEVYRASFGNYPEYDDAPNAGSVPPAPSYPPPANRWTLTGVTASNQMDEVPARDEYYYVAFSKDGCGNLSSVSNLTSGTLNYVLGDVHDGQVGHECVGNNVVFTEDMSLLGAHYGVPLAAQDPLGCLDIGPTLTGATDSRPLTDNVIDFEDLIVMALNFSATPLVATSRLVSPARAQSSAADAVWIEAPDAVEAGEEFAVRVMLTSNGDVRGISAQLAWDHSIAEALDVAPGDLTSGGAMLLSRAPGNVDVVRLGSGFSGSGTLAEVRFRAVSAGNPRARMGTLLARDAANHAIVLGSTLATPLPDAPGRTQLGIIAPNPFRTQLAIQLANAHAQRVRLRVYDLSGRLVRRLIDGDEPAGRRLVTWDGRDTQGHLAAAGVYIVRLEANEVQMSRRVQLLR